MDDFAALNLCPDQLSSGACAGPPCVREHDFRLCQPCGSVVRPAHEYSTHAATVEHINRIRGNFLRCPVCTITFLRGNWATHLTGKKHAKQAKRLGLQVRVQPETPAAVPGYSLCVPCNIWLLTRQVSGHNRRLEHVRKNNFRSNITTYIAAARSNEDTGSEAAQVDNADGLDFGVVNDENVREGAIKYLVVTTSLDTPTIELVEIIITHSNANNSAFAVRAQVLPTSVRPEANVHVVIAFDPTPRHVGAHTGRVTLRFRDVQTSREFTIGRSLRAVYGNPHDQAALGPTAPFVPRRRGPRLQLGQVVWAVRPPRFARNPYKIKIKVYLIPGDLSKALDTGGRAPGEVMDRLPVIYQPRLLQQKTYTHRMSTMLWMEEHQALIDIQIYDMEHIRLRKPGARYLLDVPGLAENRPSVLLGDGILVRAQDTPDGKWFEGLVVDVRAEEVALQFQGSFARWTPSRAYAVRFNFNRYPLRRQHQALNRPFNDERVFFPITKDVKQLSAYVVDVEPYNPLIGNNPAQMLAIRAILRLPPGSHPFIIYGPPGTGKTSTCVEAILQLLKAKPDAHVFACALSNSAADVITTRLLGHLTSEDIYRFYAPSRATGKAPVAVLACTTRGADGGFSVPSVDHVSKFRVIVSTCGSASFAYSIGVPAGHFSHIFVDESGQATEPEVMVPIKTMANASTNIVLSGDPKQLGPIVRSAIAKELGLGKSYLERLMEREVYDETTGSGKTIVKLVKNFRSHPDILSFPNKVFYNGDLRPHGHPDIINSYANWRHLSRRGFPVIFHSVSGEDKREASSPSYFNVDEITQVKAYVELLLNDRDIGIEAKDIGVITPYHAQAMKTRAALRAMTPAGRDVQVASVELFQGQERRVIIMSTVRSTQDMMAYDLRHTLGFVSNPRRFNVAVTRAQALLIVVGNPSVLGLDPLWRDFLNWVHSRGGWAGPPPPWDAAAEALEADGEVTALGFADINDFAQRMQQLRLHEESDDDVPDEDGWRVEE